MESRKFWYDKEANVYVGYFDTLKIYSQGVTKKEVIIALEDAIKSFLIVSHKINGYTFTED